MNESFWDLLRAQQDRIVKGMALSAIIGRPDNSGKLVALRAEGSDVYWPPKMLSRWMPFVFTWKRGYSDRYQNGDSRN